uniref:Trehalase n=1 Tax=Kalanchoe fedtschenkoi TaxID=63787 RepID=A0A7N0UL11_KALFE
MAITEGPVKPKTPLISFLETLQKTALATFGSKDFDPKLYVDLSLKSNLSVTIEGFGNLPKNQNGSVSVDDLKGFIEKYFEGAGNDLEYVQPVDYVAVPVGFLPKVKNMEMREWALEIHSLWKNLSRKVSQEVAKRPEFHTLLPLPGPVMIPGSRFREVYYWDSYWVIRGLLASKMYETAKAIVINLIYLIDHYGFVLNGARAYYTNRSQPPLLSSMVYEIYGVTRDIELVKVALPALLKEHAFWTSGIHKVVIIDAEGTEHILSRYYAMWDEPRPESSTIDIAAASTISNDSERKLFFREVASTAESGWDFSTRWMRDPSSFTTLTTTTIIPVDLNAFLLKVEHDLASLAKVVGNDGIAEIFSAASKARQKAMKAIMWNEERGQWFDYWLSGSSTSHQEAEEWRVENQSNTTFASNFIPIWINSFHSDESLVEKVVKSLQCSGLLGAAGISTSLTNSGQQWDLPNGWAPLQHMIIEGLSRSKSPEANKMAEDLALRWIRTNYLAFKKTGAMHEKYNVLECGETGGGGEYIPQTGFGWSNGVVMALLEQFGWSEDLSVSCE